jgi:RNA polymerase sigma factor (sigma-70 family)
MATDILDRVKPLTAGQRRNAEETYLEVENLIRREVWRICKKWGGDFDELMSEANIAFLDAYDSFDGSSSFATWTRQIVWYKCVDLIRGRLTEQARYASNPGDETVGRIPCRVNGDATHDRMLIEIPDRPHSTWKVQEMLEELTEDARIVVKLVVETPAELEAIARAKGGQPRNLRSSIRSYLAEAGWTAARIAESFNEVRQVLSN